MLAPNKKSLVRALGIPGTILVACLAPLGAWYPFTGSSRDRVVA
jgi:hypothetical protein